MTATSTYYYNVKATAYDGTNKRTGGGKVYAGISQNDPPTGSEWYFDWGWKQRDFNKYSRSNNQDGWAFGPRNSYGTNTFYYYAVADDDYVFSHCR